MMVHDIENQRPAMTGCSTSLNFMGPAVRLAMSTNQRVQTSFISPCHA
jgi:hypothetical protein